jgi:transcriptional regulator with XRE-family HTH domain
MLTAALDTQRMPTKAASGGGLSARLKAALAHAGLNQQQLEEKCDFKPGYLSRHVSGDRERMDGERMARIAMATGVDVRWLASGIGDMVGSHRPAALTQETRVEYDNTAIPTGEEETPLERAINAAFDARIYMLRDLNAAAAAARTLHRKAKQGSDPSWARDFLEAARLMRVDGEETTPQAVKDRVIAMRMDPETDATRAAAKKANEEARRMSEEFDAPSTGRKK